jgi:transcriptional regulator with XRE-family HTH domain
VVADFKKKSDVIPEIQGEVLRAAREKIKITPSDLAKKACLSKKHIIELEDGGNSAFFSPDHKVRVAKKVSLLLGLDEDRALFYPSGELAKQESLRFDEVPSDDIKQVATLKSSQLLDSAPSASKQPQKLAAVIEDFDIEKILKNAPPLKISEPKNIVSLESLSQNNLSSKPSTGNSRKFLWPLILIPMVAIGLFVTKDVISDLINPKSLPVPTAIELAPENAEAKSGDGPVVVPATQPVAPTPAVPVPAVPAPVPPTTSTPSLPSEASCPKPDATVASHLVWEPTKPGNFVFIQTKIKQTICVSDASGKVTVVSLDVGGSHTFTGKAPFTVLSSGLSNLVMFFQGRPVRYSNDQARSLRLEEGKVVN